jgi:hypothetical protein
VVPPVNTFAILVYPAGKVFTVPGFWLTANPVMSMSFALDVDWVTLAVLDVPDAVGFPAALGSNGEAVFAPETPKAMTVNLNVPVVWTVIVFENVDEAMADHSSTSAK